jgi:hypothetical protein
MKYTVVYTALEDLQLAPIWLDSPDRQEVADASQQIDRRLSRDADQIGHPDTNGWRVLIEPPLVVSFRVSPDDRMATVLSVRYRP